MNERNNSGAFAGYSPDQQAGQYQQVQPVQPPQQYQQAASQYQPYQPPIYQQPYQAPQQPTKKKKGCLAKLLTWVAVALALLLVIGIVGGSNTDAPASATKNPAPVAQNKAQTAAPVKSNETMSQRNALNSAKSYLRFTSFSREGLIKQLEYEQYSLEDAVYAVDNCGADWSAQAVASAKSYLGIMSFSRQGLIDQLEHDGFTTQQATHGADSSGADWNAEAVEAAKSYLELMPFSRQGLIDQLKHDGYTDAQAAYGVTGAGY